jgi:hypothetical protein
MPLPELSPTSVTNLNLPDYSVEISEDQDGVERRSVITDNGRETDISIFYNSLSEEQALEFITAYEESVSNNRGFGLPNTILEYPDLLFQEVLKVLGQVNFYFRKAPRINTEKVSGVYSVNLYLTAKQVTLIAPKEVFTILSTFVTVSVETTVPFVQWVQLSGQELIIESPFSTTTKLTAAAGNITNVLGEIIVRVFLIDNPLIYQDVIINARPTDTVDSSALKISSTGTYLKEFQSGYNVLAPIRWELSNPLGNITFNPNTGNAFNPLQIYWYDPLITEFLLRFEIEYYNGINWYTVITQDAKDYNYALVQPNQTFRIVSIHSINGGEEFKAISDKVFNINPLTATEGIITASEFFPSLKTIVTTIQEIDFVLDFYFRLEEEAKQYTISLESSFTGIVESSTSIEYRSNDLDENTNLSIASSFTIMIEVSTDLGGGQIG